MLWYDKEYFRKQPEDLRSHPWRAPRRMDPARIVALAFAGAALLLAMGALADEPYVVEEDATIYEVDDGVRLIQYRSGRETTCYDLGDNVLTCEGDRNVTCYEHDSGVVECEEE